MRSTVLTSWFLALSLALTPAAVADYQTSYGHGLEALDKKLWSEAADWFRKAIDEKPQAGGKVSAAGKRQTYLPYFQLGLALYRAGALREASEAWRTSALQGVLSRKMRETVEAYRWDIEARLAEQAAASRPPPDVEPQPRLSGQQLETRQRAARAQMARADRQIAALGASDLRVAFNADPSLAVRRDQAVEKLRQAREIYKNAGESGNPVALQEVHERAVDAATTLEDVRFSATLLALKLEPKPESADGEISSVEVADVAPDDLPPAAEPAMAEPARVEPVPTVVEPAPSAVPAPAVVEPAPAVVEPAPAAVKPGPAAEEPRPTAQASKPPGFLREAAIAFFSARYEDALSVLDHADLADDRVRKHAQLFRAASLYALYLLGDRSDAARLQSAEAAARACHAIDSGLRPTQEGFSPSFVSFFDSVAR